MADQGATHEVFADQDDVKVGSERAFGLVFAVFFGLIGLLPLWSGGDYRLWALIVAAAFLAAALAVPKVLKPLNILWFRFGLLLHKIVTPLIMGMLFFVTVTPIALFFRLAGKDPLNRRFDPGKTSYWTLREPGDPAPESMRRQF
ncbi:MAG: SxtJ family membrane protein [Rhodospirillaceae bacterium]